MKIKFLVVCMDGLREGPVMKAFLMKYLEKQGIKADIELAAIYPSRETLVAPTKSIYEMMRDQFDIEIKFRHTKCVSAVQDLKSFGAVLVPNDAVKKAMVKRYRLGEKMVFVLNQSGGGIPELFLHKDRIACTELIKKCTKKFIEENVRVLATAS